jgi:hypothetical protein
MSRRTGQSGLIESSSKWWVLLGGPTYRAEQCGFGFELPSVVLAEKTEGQKAA